MKSKQFGFASLESRDSAGIEPGLFRRTQHGVEKVAELLGGELVAFEVGEPPAEV